MAGMGSSGQMLRVAIEDCLCGGGLRLEDWPIRDVAVPFDQRRNRTSSANHGVEKSPDGGRDRMVVAIDQQKVALVIRLFGVASQMNLTDMVHRKIGEICKG